LRETDLFAFYFVILIWISSKSFSLIARNKEYKKCIENWILLGLFCAGKFYFGVRWDLQLATRILLDFCVLICNKAIKNQTSHWRPG
jgi:hypothetical protein